MYGPKWPFLLMYESHDMRHTSFPQVDGLSTDPQDLGRHNPGCRKFTKLSALVKLYNLKARYEWSDKAFSELLNCSVKCCLLTMSYHYPCMKQRRL